MTLSHTAPARAGQVLDLLPPAPSIDQFRQEPRCRVCRNDVVRRTVNDMLAAGAGYAYIVRALAADNATLDEKDRVTIDSVRNHCARHFPVQNVARATYRDILERRAQENHIDFAEGVATALTPMAFFEVVMAKAFRTLVNDDVEVSIDTGLRAAEKLPAVLDKRDRGDEVADMRRQVNMILEAVKAVVPEEYWGQIVARLDQAEQPARASTDEDEYDDAFDPGDGDEF